MHGNGPTGKWSPLFDVCHYLLAALAVRSEVGLARSKAQPLATWMATAHHPLRSGGYGVYLGARNHRNVRTLHDSRHA